MSKKSKVSENCQGTWYPVKEGSVWRIRRMVTLPNGKRTQERLDRKTYKGLPNSYEALLQHCDRINYGQNMAKQRQIEIESAFIPEEILKGFQTELLAAIEDPLYANYLFEKSLKTYFLRFFVNYLKLPDPNTWAQKQVLWGLALIGKDRHKIFDTQPSERTISLSIQTANRFLKYLHQQMPGQYPAIKLSPVSNAVLKLYTANRQAKSVGRYVTDEDWAELQKHLPDDIRPFVHLMYFYGLRRAESLGFQSTTSVKRGYLWISHQLRSTGENPVYVPLKNREQRKTPHWFSSGENTYKLLERSLENKLHPDTLSNKFDQLMVNLGWTYHLHDFRRTFITRALRVYNPRDVQLAVGHSDLRTTMKYAQDDRILDDEVLQLGKGA